MHERATGTLQDGLGAGRNAASAARHVFVYGTLRRGEVNDINRLRPPPHRCGEATVSGVLFDLGAYPGLRLASSMAVDDPLTRAVVEVAGEVYAIDPALEPVLDEIEEVFPQRSGEYAKREVDVRVNGIVLRALVYEIAPDRVQGRAVIAGGDWVLRNAR
ncbi:MAG: gamma-glutamylcyclotransferase [Betaproteobacteria bacterium]|nr:gamma-glutamylcyclotransferase [Betaproteobacteria bacterium]